MKVALLQIDGKLPNVALMRLAAHHRAQGDEVSFRYAPTRDAVECNLFAADRIYASTIFEWSRPIAERLLAVHPRAIVGGTGWDVATTLEGLGVSTKAQDYTIYPNFTGSIGFTQRGCRLRCGFCVVPRKEGAVSEEQTIAELWRGDPWPRHLHLLDNDFFGQPRWRERVEEIRDGAFRVCFNQGINARFLTDESAAALASLDYRADDFKDRRIYTAWDNVGDERRLFAGLEALRRHGVKPDHVMVYMLVGYLGPGLPAGPITAADLYRQEKLREWGARPYPMPFDRSRPDLRGFAKWVIGSHDKRHAWETFVAARFQPRNLYARRLTRDLDPTAPLFPPEAVA